MPTRIAHREGKILVHFFRCLQPETQRHSIFQKGATTRIGIQGKIGVHQRPPFGRGAHRAVATRFFIARKEDNDIALGLKPLSFQP